jgi:2-polyprenyl-3-methyl-5-hydroxy-6-metoxy-1,4-benzoquinol methylase
MHQDFFKRFLTGRSGRLLDMGCGLGFFLKAMAPYANWGAYGCEISPAAVRYAREKLGLQNVICGRLEDADFPQSSFDVITMWDVIDHILRPDLLLKRCHALLREGGICFIRTPNILIHLPRARLIKLLRGMRPGVAYLQARDHLHHYSMPSIRRLLKRNGFSRVEFVHLHPIQSVSRNASKFVGGVKKAWFEVVRGLAITSRGHLNFDNLFVVAYKDSIPKR